MQGRLRSVFVASVLMVAMIGMANLVDQHPAQAQGPTLHYHDLPVCTVFTVPLPPANLANCNSTCQYRGYHYPKSDGQSDCRQVDYQGTPVAQCMHSPFQ